MKRLLTVITSGLLAVGAAYGQSLELKDKASVGETANAGACFSPDGKKILLANADNDKEAITYTISDINGKEKKQVYKFKLGQFKQFRPQEMFNVFNSRKGVFSSDGNMFVTCPDLDKDEVARVIYSGIPAAVCGMDGKTVMVRRLDRQQQNVANYFYGLLLINAVFGKDDEVYYVIQERGSQTETGLAGTSKIMKFDPKSNTTKTVASMDVIAAPMIYISPDKTRLAGMLYQMEIENRSVARQAMKYWAYDIPSGKVSYSMPVTDGIYNAMPNIVWSQDSSTIYGNLSMAGLPAGLHFFRPFVKPQKPDEQEAGKFKELVSQLGDEDYKQRDSASSKLQTAGAKAVEILNEAAGSSDPEIAGRAKKLLADMTGKIVTILDRRNIDTFVEVAPGFLCVKNTNSKSISLVDVETRKSRTVFGSDDLVLIDKAGDLGLFRDGKDQSIWTAKLVFNAADSRPASQAGDDDK